MFNIANIFEKTQNNDLFISPTNKFHKMDFFGEKAILEESNGKLR